MDNIIEKLAPHIKMGICRIDFEINDGIDLDDVKKDLKSLMDNDKTILGFKINKTDRFVSMKKDVNVER